MKVVISIPDELFERAEALALKLKKTRSGLYREALAEFLARHDPDAVTDAYNAVADELADEGSDFRMRANRRRLQKSEWTR